MAVQLLVLLATYGALAAAAGAPAPPLAGAAGAAAAGLQQQQLLLLPLLVTSLALSAGMAQAARWGRGGARGFQGSRKVGWGVGAIRHGDVCVWMCDTRVSLVAMNVNFTDATAAAAAATATSCFTAATRCTWRRPGCS